MQRQNRLVGFVFIRLQMQGDALALEGIRIGLNLHILIEQPVDCLLRFGKTRFERRGFMQAKLLFDAAGKIPTEEHERIAPMAFRVQKTPFSLFGRQYAVPDQFDVVVRRISLPSYVYTSILSGFMALGVRMVSLWPLAVTAIRSEQEPNEGERV